MSCLCEGGGEDDDGEPDKMAIAAQRISRFVAWVKRSIIGFLRGGVNFIVRIIRCQSPRRQDIAMEMTEDKDFQVRLATVDRRRVGKQEFLTFSLFSFSLPLSPFRVKMVT